MCITIAATPKEGWSVLKMAQTPNRFIQGYNLLQAFRWNINRLKNKRKKNQYESTYKINDHKNFKNKRKENK